MISEAAWRKAWQSITSDEEKEPEARVVQTSPTPPQASDRAVTSVKAASATTETARHPFPSSFDSIRRGERVLARGARGPEITRTQEALQRAGFALPQWGADGIFGAETARALLRFQAAHRLPQSGRLDAATLAQLEQAAKPRAPRYATLFADGVLRTTLAIGFDEAGSHEKEVADVRSGLTARGYRSLDVARLSSAERERLGVADEPDARYFTRAFVHDGKPVTAVVKLVTPDSPRARERFANGIANDELVLYGGHGRYGSGPDFDDIHSPAGNFVIGPPFEAGHVTLGANDLSRTKLTDGYQLMFFDGCNTFRYFDDLRARPKNKTTANLDVIGSTTELYWNDTARNLFAMLDGVTAGKNLDALESELDEINRTGSADERHYFVGNGFEDN